MYGLISLALVGPRAALKILRRALVQLHRHTQANSSAQTQTVRAHQDDAAPQTHQTDVAPQHSRQM